MRKRASLLALALIACSGAAREPHTYAAEAARASLTGAWDASLSLTRPYPLGMSSPSARRICGTIGFVADHRRTGSDQADAASLGVYDLDLSRLGLNWLADSPFPSALATAPLDSAASLYRPDPITIVLNPGSSERIVLLGSHDLVGIEGNWVAQSARGTASGSFSLRPHDAARRSC